MKYRFASGALGFGTWVQNVHVVRCQLRSDNTAALGVDPRVQLNAHRQLTGSATGVQLVPGAQGCQVFLWLHCTSRIQVHDPR